MHLLRTKLHHFRFPSDSHPGYTCMIKEIDANGVGGRGHRMRANDMGGKYDAVLDRKQIDLVVEEVVLDLSHMFENQWNETEESGNRRLFDWYEGINYNNGREIAVRYGHWLEITDEMIEARKSCFKCGYCGHQYGPHHEMPVPEDGFCHNCLTSEYLEEGNLPLLKLSPVVDGRKRPPFSDADKAYLLPLFTNAQITGRDARNKQQLVDERNWVIKRREEVVAKCEKEVLNAQTERDGFLWALDHGLSTKNFIFYPHSQEFCFGWREPVSDSFRDAILNVISEFPFKYAIKCKDGKKLENYVET